MADDVNNNNNNNNDDDQGMPKTVTKSEVMDLILQKMQALEKSELEGMGDCISIELSFTMLLTHPFHLYTSIPSLSFVMLLTHHLKLSPSLSSLSFPMLLTLSISHL